MKLSTVELLDHLKTPEARRAAWRDLVEIYLDHGSIDEMCELRMLQLSELVEHGGQDWKRRVSQLEYVLGDDRAILSALGKLPEQGDDSLDDSPAGLSEERLIEVCEDLLQEPPVVDDVVVWFVVHNAALPAQIRKIGSVTVLDFQVVETSLNNEKALYPEFEDGEEAASWLIKHAADAEHRAFLRVELKQVPVARARALADHSVRSLIDIVEPSSSWAILEGSCAWRESVGWWGSTFRITPSDRQQLDSIHPAFDQTLQRLESIGPDFIDRVVDQDIKLMTAIDDVLWYLLVERATGPAQQIVLATRALERSLGQVSETPSDSWSIAAKRFLLPSWVIWRFKLEIADAVSAASLGLKRFGSSLGDLPERAASKLYASEAPGLRVPNVLGFAEMAEEIAESLGPGSIEQRVVGRVTEQLGNPDATLERIEELSKRFTFLLSRSERHRNAIVHGTGASTSSLEGSALFLRDLAGWVANETIHQASTGDEPLSILEKERTNLLRIKIGLANGQKWLDLEPG